VPIVLKNSLLAIFFHSSPNISANSPQIPAAEQRNGLMSDRAAQFSKPVKIPAHFSQTTP
jgi:hypothetical protein